MWFILLTWVVASVFIPSSSFLTSLLFSQCLFWLYDVDRTWLDKKKHKKVAEEHNHTNMESLFYVWSLRDCLFGLSGSLWQPIHQKRQVLGMILIAECCVCVPTYIFFICCSSFSRSNRSNAKFMRVPEESNRYFMRVGYRNRDGNYRPN